MPDSSDDTAAPAESIEPAPAPAAPGDNDDRLIALIERMVTEHRKQIDYVLKQQAGAAVGLRRFMVAMLITNTLLVGGLAGLRMALDLGWIKGSTDGHEVAAELDEEPAADLLEEQPGFSP